MKVWQCIWFLMACLVSGICAAEADTFSGQTGGGAAIIECKASASSFTLTVSNYLLVRTQNEGNFRGGQGKLERNERLGKQDFVVHDPSVLSPTAFYTMGMGGDWDGTKTAIDSLDTGKALGSGRASGRQATVTVKTKPGIQWYRLVPVADTASGRGWVGTGNQSGYGAFDVHGNEHWLIGRDCRRPTAEALAKAAQME